MANHSIYYVEDQAVAISAILNALRPGGTFICTYIANEHPMVGIYLQLVPELGPSPGRVFPDGTLRRIGLHPAVVPVQSVLEFADTPDNRLKVLSFLFLRDLTNTKESLDLGIFDGHSSMAIQEIAGSVST